MGLSVFRTKCALVLGGLIALTVGAGSMQANTAYLSASATATSALTASITCNTLTGPPSTQATFTVHAYPAPNSSTSYTVGVVQMAGLVVTPPSAVVLNSSTNTTGLVFKVSAAAGCASSTSGSNTFQLQMAVSVNGATAGSDVHTTVTDVVTATTSPLTAAPVTITCGYSSTGPVYVPGSPQTISVTSAAIG